MSNPKINEQQKEWAIKGGVGIVTALLCYAVLIGPCFQGIASLRAEISDSEKRIELHRKMLALSDSMMTSERSLSSVADRSVLIGRISDFANQNHIDVQTLTPKTDPVGNYVKLQIELQGRSTFFSILKFLQAVEEIDTAIKVKDISILRQRPQEGEAQQYPLQAQFLFETLLKQQAKKKNA